MSASASLEAIAPADCWALLRTRRVGRLAFTERALPAIRPLNYAVVGHRIMVRLAGADLGRRLDGQIVAFEVDDTDDSSGWSVVVTGTVDVLVKPADLTRASGLPASWAGEGHQDAAAITVAEITGRRIRSMDEKVWAELLEEWTDRP